MSGPKGRGQNRIKARCEELGLRQTQAAKLADMTQPHFNRYACGKSTPTVFVAIRIANALDTTVDYLFDMKGALE